MAWAPSDRLVAERLAALLRAEAAALAEGSELRSVLFQIADGFDEGPTPYTSSRLTSLQQQPGLSYAEFAELRELMAAHQAREDAPPLGGLVRVLAGPPPGDQVHLISAELWDDRVQLHLVTRGQDISAFFEDELRPDGLPRFRPGPLASLRDDLGTLYEGGIGSSSHEPGRHPRHEAVFTPGVPAGAHRLEVIVAGERFDLKL